MPPVYEFKIKRRAAGGNTGSMITRGSWSQSVQSVLVWPRAIGQSALSSQRFCGRHVSMAVRRTTWHCG